jgi:intracellular sulfur oxidation DsrE/DsrF family protein
MRLFRIVSSIIVLGSTVAALGCGANTAVTETVVSIPARDGVFVHISRGPEDPHRVLMALNMAVMMAADRDVLVYFDIDGIAAVLEDAPDITFDGFPSSLLQLTRLQELEVPVFACPGCLKAAGKTPDDLAPTVRVAEKDAFFGFTDGRILTLDY